MGDFKEKKEVLVKNTRKRKNKKRKKLIYNIIIIILCSVLVFCIYNIISYFLQDFRNENLNGDLAGDYVSYPDDTVSADVSDESAGSGGGPKKEVVVPESIDFEKLKAQNKDVVGWIFSKNGVINYPILQGKDNSYYLNHLINGKKNINGSIFMDYSSRSDFSGANTIIYGHSMDNGSMFRTLLNYKKQSYYNKYPEMYIFTPSGKYKLVIFAAYETNSNDMAYGRIIGEAGMNKYISHTFAKSKIKTDVQVGVGDNIVTLSTCAYSSNDARFIVAGKLVKDGESADENANAETNSGYYDSLFKR